MTDCGQAAPERNLRRSRYTSGTSAVQVVGGVLAHLAEAAHLHLTDALLGEVEALTHLLQGDPAPVRHVHGAGLSHLPDLEVREVELDGPAGRVHVQVEVMGAARVRAGTGHALALCPGARPFDVVRIDDE